MPSSNQKPAGVSVDALDRCVRRVPEPAVDAQRLVGHPTDHVHAEELGGGCLGGEVVALLAALGRRSHEPPAGGDVGLHVGEVGLDGLAVGDRSAERDALLGEGDRLVEGPLGQADHAVGERDAAVVEEAQRHLEPLTDLAEAAGPGHPHLVEPEPRVPGPVEAHRALGGVDLEAGRVARDEERGEGVPGLAVVAGGDDQEEVGAVGERDEVLLAGEQPVVAVGHRT